MTRFTADECDRLKHYMPLCVQSSVVTDWERKFCASMIARDRSGNFRPSNKQASVMSRIVDKFQAATMRQNEDVIE